jgi:hypothetical protein
MAFRKSGKIRAPSSKKELAVRGRGRNHDVAALLSLSAKVAREDAVDGIHRLRTAAERENGRIRFRGVVPVRQDHLVLHRPASHLLRLVDHFRTQRKGGSQPRDR